MEYLRSAAVVDQITIFFWVSIFFRFLYGMASIVHVKFSRLPCLLGEYTTVVYYAVTSLLFLSNILSSFITRVSKSQN